MRRLVLGFASSSHQSDVAAFDIEILIRFALHDATDPAVSNKIKIAPLFPDNKWRHSAIEYDNKVADAAMHR